MSLTAIVIEDDKTAAEFLERYCKKTEGINLQHIFHEPAKALEYLQSTIVDLIFLDVEMPGMNGFELIDKLSYKPYIILTTGKSEYAFLAFEYNVVDFLKKPIHYTRFKDAINKVYQFEDVKPGSSPKNSEDIFIRQKGALIKIPFNTIHYIQVVEDYVKIFTDKTTHIILSTLQHFESRLDPDLFVKTHRSYIVNISMIDDIKENSLLVKGKEIPISKANKMQVRKKINVL